MKYIDLHTHSSYSDGTCSPAELVSLAARARLCAFALTDHDTIDGLTEGYEAACKAGIEFVPGIEFSTEYLGKDVHILGLDIDWKSSDFQKQLTRFQNSREIRNEKIIKRLADTGIDISWEQMQENFGDNIWTRAHFGRYLLEHGYIKEISEAFTIYIGDDCPCFVPREKVTPVQAVELIRQSGGIPVLAHPVNYRLSEEQMRLLLQELKKAGLIALEAMYSSHTVSDESYVRQLARSFGLSISGGSDFHGSNKPEIKMGTGRGNLKISYDILKQLREAAHKARGIFV